MRSSDWSSDVCSSDRQTMTPQYLATLARKFGPLNIHPYVQPLPDAPEVFAIVKEPDDRHHFGSGWHTDLSYTEKPALATMLYGVEVPSYGGDTMFANMQRAYEALSPAMKRTVEEIGRAHVCIQSLMRNSDA